MGVFSYISGALFAASWWVFVDGLVVATPHTYVFAMWVPGILGTLCFLMANMTTPGAMMSGGLFDEGNVQKHKVWFFFSILIGFGALIAAVWIMVDNSRIKDQPWPGASLIVQAFGLVAATLIFFFGRKKKSDDIM